MPTTVVTTVRTTIHGDGRVEQETETTTTADAKAGSRPARILGMGNPLLDISATVPEEFLTKYKLGANDQILAEESHMPIYDELVKNYDVSYIAGGATQNSIRVAQWLLQEPCTAYIGAVGKDKFADTLRAKAEEGGTVVEYMVDAATPTGTCAVLITGANRSLVANISAANSYKETHLKETAWKLVENADIFYISGFFITVSPPSIQMVGKHAAEKNKMFAMNLAAPFIMMVPPFREALVAALPYCDFVFGNESEFGEFAKQMELGTEDLKEVAKHIAALPKENKKRPRTVVVTQGQHPTIVCHEGIVEEYPIHPIIDSHIVDTNGAGDAWVGGFLAALAKDHSIKDCVEAAFYAAKVIIQQSGCTFPEKPIFSL